MTKRIIIAVSNDLNTDQRVQRIANTLSDQGYSIIVLGRILPNSLPVHFSFPTKRFRLLFNTGPLFYANLNVRLFWYLLWHRFHIVLSNDLDTLAGCRMASIIKRKKVVYDSHEFFTEVPELVGRHWQKKFWQCIEKIFLPGVDRAYTVCKSLADIYTKEYEVPFSVIHNVPYRNSLQPAELLRNSKVIIYQGALNLGRGIELMIDSMSFLPDFELWIAGTGDIELQLKNRVQHQNKAGKIIFLGRLSPDELKTKTAQASIGLSLEEDLGLNYHYALPNKLFDYIQAQIPVIISDLPEMRNLVETYGVGEWLVERTPQALAHQIVSLFENSVKFENYKMSLSKAASELCWENEQQKLIDIFKTVIDEKE